MSNSSVTSFLGVKSKYDNIDERHNITHMFISAFIVYSIQNVYDKYIDTFYESYGTPYEMSKASFEILETKDSLYYEWMESHTHYLLDFNSKVNKLIISKLKYTEDFINKFKNHPTYRNKNMEIDKPVDYYGFTPTDVVIYAGRVYCDVGNSGWSLFGTVNRTGRKPSLEISDSFVNTNFYSKCKFDSEYDYITGGLRKFIVENTPKFTTAFIEPLLFVRPCDGPNENITCFCMIDYFEIIYEISCYVDLILKKFINKSILNKYDTNVTVDMYRRLEIFKHNPSKIYLSRMETRRNNLAIRLLKQVVNWKQMMLEDEEEFNLFYSNESQNKIKFKCMEDDLLSEFGMLPKKKKKKKKKNKIVEFVSKFPFLTDEIRVFTSSILRWLELNTREFEDIDFLYDIDSQSLELPYISHFTICNEWSNIYDTQISNISYTDHSHLLDQIYLNHIKDNQAYLVTQDPIYYQIPKTKS